MKLLIKYANDALLAAQFDTTGAAAQYVSPTSHLQISRTRCTFSTGAGLVTQLCFQPYFATVCTSPMGTMHYKKKNIIFLCQYCPLHTSVSTRVSSGQRVAGQTVHVITNALHINESHTCCPLLMRQTHSSM